MPDGGMTSMSASGTAEDSRGRRGRGAAAVTGRRDMLPAWSRPGCCGCSSSASWPVAPSSGCCWCGCRARRTTSDARGARHRGRLDRRVIERDGGVAPASLVEEVLDLHQAYLRDATSAPPVPPGSASWAPPPAPMGPQGGPQLSQSPMGPPAAPMGPHQAPIRPRLGRVHLRLCRVRLQPSASAPAWPVLGQRPEAASAKVRLQAGHAVRADVRPVQRAGRQVQPVARGEANIPAQLRQVEGDDPGRRHEHLVVAVAVLGIVVEGAIAPGRGSQALGRQPCPDLVLARHVARAGLQPTPRRR